jgi:hypothetical protein
MIFLRAKQGEEQGVFGSIRSYDKPDRYQGANLRDGFCKGFDLGIDKPSAGCLFERMDRRAIGFFQQVQFICTEPKRKEPCEGIGSGVPVF